MKILILATDIYTRSGIARYTWTLASALGDLIGPDNVHVLALLNTGGLQDTPRAFRILDALAERPAPAAKLRFAAKALAQARQKYDLTVCSHVALAPIVAVIRRLYGTPFWVACHDAEVWDPVPPLKLAGLKRAQLALPVSRFTAEKLSEVSGIAPGKIRVLHNAIQDEFATLLLSKNGDSSSTAGQTKRERYILSVGSLAKAHAYKGFDMVIRTLRRLLTEIPNLRYVIVGAGDNQPYLESLAGQNGVREKVIFAGRVSDQQLTDYYHGCDVFVMPSRASKENGRWQGEGFGRVYVEAALAGRPVVGSTGGGSPEAVLHGKTGLLVDPTSVAELSDALLTLLLNPEIAAAMGREARSWARQAFTQASLRSQLASLLRDTIGPLPGSRSQRNTCNR